jgi:UDP-N-acetylglucosamine--N-acetylmuramyl-(pentapeptide) pyrophosphoryl-undecaprenol N-acetylglucosamine transferase
MNSTTARPFVAIACGGTGGHLFPGIAVAAELRARGAECALLISRKDVDQQAARTAPDLEAIALPGVGLSWRHPVKFLRGALESHREAKRCFESRSPRAVLAMGGFTSLPAVLAARRCGAKAFLHESNAIPGRANRWLARLADEAFISYESAAEGFAARRVTLTGTPVRERFQPQDAAAARTALGLDPRQPVLLTMGGSQGAHGVNDLVLAALPALAAQAPALQFIHLTGEGEEARVRAAYNAAGRRASVMAFCSDMEVAMGAATIAVSRAGASTLAELAAMRLPSILVPYPHAVDNHQWFNGRALERSGAARMLWNHHSSPADLVRVVTELLADSSLRATMAAALFRWHHADAAARIAGRILSVIGHPEPAAAGRIASLGAERAHPDSPSNAFALHTP